MYNCNRYYAVQLVILISTVYPVTTGFYSMYLLFSSRADGKSTK